MSGMVALYLSSVGRMQPSMLPVKGMFAGLLTDSCPALRPRARGFVQEDNSGKSNIFGVEVRCTQGRILQFGL